VAQFEMKKPLEEIPVLRPAFRWAQSLKAVMLEVKFSTRFDSPACLDLSNERFEVSEDMKQLHIEALCKNDKKLLIYRLIIDLYDVVMPEVMPEESMWPTWVKPLPPAPKVEKKRTPTAYDKVKEERA
jgi:hypothetical protein